MQLLLDRIRAEGRILPGDIIKVDGFLNHRVDPQLLRAMAREFARRIDTTGVTAVLTVEASGIPLGTICAEELKVPLLFAKKAKSDNIDHDYYRHAIYSYTYKRNYTLLLSREWLGPLDKVLIIDDFLANGEALRGLIGIADQAGAEILGIGVAVEKGFQSGGKRLREAGYNLYSLAIIDSVGEDGFVFRENESFASKNGK